MINRIANQKVPYTLCIGLTCCFFGTLLLFWYQFAEVGTHKSKFFSTLENTANFEIISYDLLPVLSLLKMMMAPDQSNDEMAASV